MTVPEDFRRAYEALDGLVGRLAVGEPGGPRLREEVRRWRREDCRDATTLAKAAVLALRYELGSGALAGDPEGAAPRLRALAGVEALLEPPAEGDEPEISRVNLPEALRRSVPNARGYRMGRFQILFEPSDGPPRGHLSVSHPSRYPTWEELLRAREAPGGPPPNLWAWLPKPGEGATGANPYTVHLYVLPPREFLG